jgi:hypothetical protein
VESQAAVSAGTLKKSTGLREGMSQKKVTFLGSENLKSEDSIGDRPFLLRFLNTHVIKQKGKTSIL